MKPKLTEALARAAAMDAGDRSAKEHGRKRWEIEDFNAATAELDRLWPDSCRAKNKVAKTP